MAEINKTSKTVAKKEELVPYEVYFDGTSKHSDDAFACVNGKSMQIKRGETVMIPDYFKAMLEDGRKQDLYKDKLIRKQSDEFASNRKIFE